LSVFSCQLKDLTMLEYVSTHGAPFLADWDIHGASRENTDNGRCWVRVAENGGEFTCTLYRDADRTEPVAAGTLDAATGEMSLAELNDSGLTGTVRLTGATPADAIIDVFYACDADLLSRQAEIAGFLKEGNFAGREGFSEPCLRAKRVLDALLDARIGADWIADDLQPLADTTACYALSFLYDYLSTRGDDPASHLATHWRHKAREALPRIRLSLGGCEEQLFEPRLIRS
jgi:hypothetical protein